MSSTPATLDITDGVARIVLNRPDKLNAVSPDLLAALSHACDSIERDARVRAVTLTGAGRAFCAGADLQVVQELAGDAVRWSAFIASWHRVLNRLEAMPQIVVAGIHGMALAGGLEFVLACDLAVADEDARLGDQHANFGLVAGAGGSQRLPRLIGARRAKELMLLGGWLSAREALGWGLVNRVAPSGQLRETVDALATELAAKSVAASRTAKRLVNRGLDVDLATGLELEKTLVAEHMSTADAAEGLRAFSAKRKPVFHRA